MVGDSVDAQMEDVMKKFLALVSLYNGETILLDIESQNISKAKKTAWGQFDIYAVRRIVLVQQ